MKGTKVFDELSLLELENSDCNYSKGNVCWTSVAVAVGVTVLYGAYYVMTLATPVDGGNDDEFRP